MGLYEKQSSFFVQAKAAESRVLSNVFFNGPRAGINMNDGFGGGDELLISEKQLFPTVLVALANVREAILMQNH